MYIYTFSDIRGEGGVIGDKFCKWLLIWNYLFSSSLLHYDATILYIQYTIVFIITLFYFQAFWCF